MGGRLGCTRSIVLWLQVMSTGWDLLSEEQHFLLAMHKLMPSSKISLYRNVFPNKVLPQALGKFYRAVKPIRPGRCQSRQGRCETCD